MENTIGRNWTAQIVIASEHAGLKPEFRALEDEVRHVLSRVDEPRDVRDYLQFVIRCSGQWLKTHQAIAGSK